jgi:hypothetical protein
MWPYVNGKALMSGKTLGDMEASDMVDVIHFMFEEDTHYVSEESAKSRSGVRVAIYKDLYGKPYKYEYKDAKKRGTQNASSGYIADYGDSSSLEYMSDAEARQGFEPEELKEPMKPPAQPPTEFNPYAENPFAGILDAPMN